MTLKDTILKFLCFKPDLDDYPPEIDLVNKKLYKTKYETSGHCNKSSSELKCGNCELVIKGGFSIILLSHYVIENREETFLSDELKPFCDLCYIKRILMGTRYGKKKEICTFYYKHNE